MATTVLLALTGCLAILAAGVCADDMLRRRRPVAPGRIAPDLECVVLPEAEERAFAALTAAELADLAAHTVAVPRPRRRRGP